MEGAKIHAENAIRQKNQALNYRRMSARIDAVAARVQTALTTKQVQLFVLILRCVFIIATVPTSCQFSSVGSSCCAFVWSYLQRLCNIKV